MRRFEFVEGSSSKFWQIALDGASFTVQWGKIGTAGQSQVKEFASAAAAQAEHDKLVKEKTKKGYAEVGAAAVATPAPTPKAAPAEAAAPATPKASKPRKEVAAEAPAEVPAAPAPSSAPLAPVEAPTAAVGEIDWESVSDLYPPEDWDKAPPDAFPAMKAAWASQSSLWAAATVDDNLKQAFFEAQAWLQAPAAGVLSPQAAAILLSVVEPDGDPYPHINTVARPNLAAKGPGWALDLAAALARVTISPNHWQRKNDKLPQYHGLHEREPAPSDIIDGWTLRRLRTLTLELFDVATVRDTLEARWPGLSYFHRVGFLCLLPDDTALADTIADEWLLTEGMVNGHTPRSYENHGIKPTLGFHYSADRLWPMAKKVMGWPFSDNFLSDRTPLLLRYYGAAALPFFKLNLDRISWDHGIIENCRLAAAIQTPEAASLVVAQLTGQKSVREHVTTWCREHPRRALPALAQAVASRGKISEIAGALLLQIDRANPGLLVSQEPGFSATVQAALKRLRERMGQLPAAPAEAVPAILRDPPWLAAKRPAPPAAIEIDVLSAPPERVHWEAGLREYRLRSLEQSRSYRTTTPEAILKEKGDSKWGRKSAISELQYCTLEDIRRAWNTWDADCFGYSWYLDVGLVALDIDAIPGYLRIGGAQQKAVIELLSVVESPRVAGLMAHGRTTKNSRKSAEAWLLRFPEAAIAGLLPVALGKAGEARTKAESALRFLAAKGHQDALRARLSGPALAATDAMLAFDPRQTLPAKIPKLPAFWKADELPRPLLKNRQHSLPPSAIDAIGTMLSISSLEAPYVGLEDVVEACDAASLEELSWGIFLSWNLAGADSKQGWAFQQLGLLGRDEVARRLTPLIREWPGESQSKRAETGLDLLASIGTDLALMNLNGIAQKLKYKALQEKARLKMDEVAAARGLTAEELADRLVPDLDLEADGTRTLDYGPRQFKVCFDEALKPFVKDGTGKALPDLPKPNKADDAEKAKEAEATWKTLKKDAKAIATTQIVRLEQCMCGQRRWESDSWRALLLDHPLLINLVRRLIWGVYGTDGALRSTFRVAEDGTLADRDDGLYELPDDSTLGLPHALELSAADSAAWGQILGDYQVIQPFPQIGRDVYSPTAAERATAVLDRRKGHTVATGKVLGMVEQKGWRKGPPQDAGWIWEMSKSLPGGLSAELGLDTGIGADMQMTEPKQVLGSLVLSGRPNITLGDLPAAVFSELVRDLIQLGSA